MPGWLKGSTDRIAGRGVCSVPLATGETFMRWLVLAGFLAVSPAVAQQPEATPVQCRPDAQGSIDYVACANAAAPGSQPYITALINLGTQAVFRREYAAAVQLYDAAVPPGKQIFSDAAFHAFRGDAYFHVGRRAEAFNDAHVAALILLDRPDAPAEIRTRPDRYGWDKEMAFVAILPLLKEARDSLFDPALKAYQALPEDGWQSLAMRAAVSEKVGDIGAAVGLSNRVISLQPANPVVLNNHCYILTRANRAMDALAFCRKALEAGPGEAGFHHSYAAALAGAGMCIESRQSLSEARRLDPVSATYKEEIACTPRL